MQNLNLHFGFWEMQLSKIISGQDFMCLQRVLGEDGAPNCCLKIAAYLDGSNCVNSRLSHTPPSQNDIQGSLNGTIFAAIKLDTHA